MPDRVAVLISSRNRPEELWKARASVGVGAEVMVFVDDDQVPTYQNRRVLPEKWRHAPYGTGPIPGAKMLLDSWPDYAAYGFMCDDMVMEIDGWEGYVLDTIASVPDRVVAISPSHNLGNHVDIPFVSREWIERVGWMFLPGTKHYAWPTAIHHIGLMSDRLVHAPGDRFRIRHNQMSQQRGWTFEHDAGVLYEFMMGEIFNVVDRMKASTNG